ncbi:Mce family protein [Gordonia hirsuta DSM 44140 = NBRC 16056]|uniref:Mce family protein n=1 Tax=Gordonia hirsuta DSM 44140 = NBRC 16056 TaxID=1121927 RepID=L7LEA8_9ACTN|nr:MCE family protein [Gordonia hirsuta]GAC58402.1 Mce family protein [Gordonia hirsuta DSM 44140 = NBRC 16056]
MPTVNHQLRWGLAGIALVVVIALVSVGLYVFTPGQYRVVAQFAEAGQIRVGDNVRVAGVPVGSVKKLTLAGTHVDVELAVQRGTFIGDESIADIKMLTIVGGNYVDITSIGYEQLPAGEPIPVESTSVPYSLIETFQTLAPKVDRIDGRPVRDLLIDLDQGLADNPGSLSGTIETLSSMLTNLQRRQDEFGGMLATAAEYSQSLTASSDVLVTLAQNLSAFLSEYITFGQRLNVSLEGLASMLSRMGGAAAAVRADLDPLLAKIDVLVEQFTPFLEQGPDLIGQGRDLIRRLEGMVADDGGLLIDHSALVFAADLCVPIPGVKC